MKPVPVGTLHMQNLILNRLALVTKTPTPPISPHEDILEFLQNTGSLWCVRQFRVRNIYSPVAVQCGLQMHHLGTRFSHRELSYGGSTLYGGLAPSSVPSGPIGCRRVHCIDQITIQIDLPKNQISHAIFHLLMGHP